MTIERLSVVVPFLNEAATLRPAVDRLLKTILPVEIEVLLVDDGSTDASVSTVADLVQAGTVTLLTHPSSRGKGAALRTGLDHASGDVLTVLDADLEYDPANYSELLAPILEGESEIVYGSRSFTSHTAYSFWYVIGNKALALWASFLYNTWLSDIETCFKMAPLRTWQSLDLRSDGFGIEAETTAKLLRRHHRIFEVPIRYKARGREQGKKLRWTDGVQALWILFKLRLVPRRWA